LTALTDLAALVPWLIFFATWWIWSWRARAEVARAETVASRYFHLVLLYASFLLLGARLLPLGPVSARLYEAGPAAGWAGIALEVGGLAFAIWARAALGANWSLNVAVKRDHRLVLAGPYGIVRHPIYTGLLAMFLGAALAFGTAAGFAGTLLMAIAYLRKIRLEERWMREEFGDAYDTYAARVRALVPFVF